MQRKGRITLLTDEEVERLCRPGEGANTCSWIVIGRHGFECTIHDKHPVILRRLAAGTFRAKRDGCDEGREFAQEQARLN